MLEVTEMSRGEMAALLLRGRFGHLGCSRDGHPYVVPMNYAYDSESLYFFTTEGTKTEYIGANHEVCFQVEEVADPARWESVMVFGRAERVTPVEVIHGRLPVVAYRFNDFAYLTDLSEIPPASLELLRGLDVLVLDCLRIRPHPTHLWLERALEYVAELKPRRTFFTHIAHDVKHARDSALLPSGVEFAYDGLEISDE